MKIGWLVVNKFLTGTKYDEIYGYLQRAAVNQDLSLILKYNDELISSLKFDETGKVVHNFGILPDFVIFWDKDLRLAKLLEAIGLKLYNSADAIEACDDKFKTAYMLSGTGIRMPRTMTGPMTFFRTGVATEEYLDMIESEFDYPVVVKECFGSFGAQVWLAENRSSLKNVITSCENRPFIIQEFIASTKGHDIRINVVGNEAVASMFRYNDNDFRSNITNGGLMKPYTPDSRQLEIALTAVRKLGLCFAGVDIMFGPDNEPILCEVNSNAHFKNIFDCTGVNVADYIISYIRNDVG